MNETVEMSKLRGEISILKEELQRVKIVAEQDRKRADSLHNTNRELNLELHRAFEQGKAAMRCEIKALLQIN